jgi:DNA-binding Lrp family transcriptional regulator
MPQARQWTQTADFTICQMRGGGATWAEIGRTLGLSRNTVIERGRRLRAEAPVKVVEPIVKEVVSDDPNRGALRAGHPLTWALLTSEPYPEGDL